MDMSVPNKGYKYEIEFSVERGEVEIALLVRGNVSPIIQGQYSGPPERCYPSEGGEVEIVEILAPVDGTWSKLCPPKWDGELTEEETERAEELLREEAEKADAARYDDEADWEDD
jgi:hypothetical protein